MRAWLLYRSLELNIGLRSINKTYTGNFSCDPIFCPVLRLLRIVSPEQISYRTAFKHNANCRKTECSGGSHSLTPLYKNTGIASHGVVQSQFVPISISLYSYKQTIRRSSTLAIRRGHPLRQTDTGALNHCLSIQAQSTPLPLIDEDEQDQSLLSVP